MKRPTSGKILAGEENTNSAPCSPCRPAASRIRRRVSQGWFEILKRIGAFQRLTEDQDSVLIRRKKKHWEELKGAEHHICTALQPVGAERTERLPMLTIP